MSDAWFSAHRRHILVAFFSKILKHGEFEHVLLWHWKRVFSRRWNITEHFSCVFVLNKRHVQCLICLQDLNWKRKRVYWKDISNQISTLNVFYSQNFRGIFLHQERQEELNSCFLLLVVNNMTPTFRYLSQKQNGFRGLFAKFDAYCYWLCAELEFLYKNE